MGYPQFTFMKQRGMVRPKPGVKQVCGSCGGFVYEDKKHACPDHKWSDAWSSLAGSVATQKS